MEINKPVLNIFKKKPWRILVAIGILIFIGAFLCTELVLPIVINTDQYYESEDMESYFYWRNYRESLELVGVVIQITGLLFCGIGFGTWYANRLDVFDLIPHSRPELASKLENTLADKLFGWGALPSASLSAFSILGGMLVLLNLMIHPPSSGGGSFDIDLSGLAYAIILYFGITLIIAGMMLLGLLSLSRSKIFWRACIGAIINLIIAGAGTLLGLAIFSKISVINEFGDVDYLAVFVFFSLGTIVPSCFCAGLSALLVWEKLGYRNGN